MRHGGVEALWTLDRETVLSVGFPRRAARYRPGGSSFSSPFCWSRRCMEGFAIRGWDPIFPGWRWLMLAVSIWLEYYPFGTNLLEKASSRWRGFGG